MMTTTENYFKALGWHTFEVPFFGEAVKDMFGEWESPDGIMHKELHNITQHYPDFKKWVLEKMEGEGFVFAIIPGIYTHPVASWGNDTSDYWNTKINDNEILEAAVIAATRYWESHSG